MLATISAARTDAPDKVSLQSAKISELTNLVVLCHDATCPIFARAVGTLRYDTGGPTGFAKMLLSVRVLATDTLM
jgi:hypothetical protein